MALLSRRSRLFVRRVHLIFSLSVGILLVIISVSGSILTFEHDINRWLHPTVEWDGEDMGYEAAREHARAENPGLQLSILWFPNKVRPYYDAGYLDENENFVQHRFHPANGRELPIPGPTFMMWINEFHTTLQLGKFGRWIVDHVTLLSLFIVISGVFLWWPGWKPKYWFKIRNRGRFLNYDLHRVIGLAATPILLLSIITGLAMAFPNAARTVVWGVTGQSVPEEMENRPSQRPSTVPAEDDSVKKAADQELLTDALERAPEDAYIFYIRYPTTPEDNRQVRVQVGHDPYPFGIIYRYYYDQYSGELLGTNDPSSKPAPDAFLEKWNDPLHFGTWGGIPTQILYLIMTLAPAFLGITGWILWRRRVGREKASQKRKKRLKKSRSKKRKQIKPSSNGTAKKTNGQNDSDTRQTERVLSDSENRKD